MRDWAVVNENNVVIDAFSLPAEAIDAFKDGTTPPNPAWPVPVFFHDVTDAEPKPTFDWTRGPNGWEEPVVELVQPTAEQLQLLEDNQFIADMLQIVRDGGTLTQEQRDKLMLLQLARGQV